MKTSLILAALGALSTLAAASQSPVSHFAFLNKRSSLEHPAITKRQAVAGKKPTRYGTVVAKSPLKIGVRTSRES